MAAAVRDPVREALDAAIERRQVSVLAQDRLALVVHQELQRRPEISVRRLAQSYGVPPSSIQAWSSRGRELSEQGVTLKELHEPWMRARGDVSALDAWIESARREFMPMPKTWRDSRLPLIQDAIPLWAIWVIIVVLLLGTLFDLIQMLTLVV